MRILVTAGPTREFLDPVRFLSNRSSGKMGYALARAAIRRGHHVVLISGPTALKPPRSAIFVPIISADDMKKAVHAAWPRTDVLIMAAAVADWKPRVIKKQKLKKRDGPPSLEMERAPDILASLAGLKAGRLIIGFAAETDHLLAEAERKLREKNLDLIVANDVSRKDAGFETDTNQVALLAPGEPSRMLPLMSKISVANRLIAWAEKRFAQRNQEKRFPV